MEWLEMAVRMPAAAMQLGIKTLSDIWGAMQGNAAQGVDGLLSQMAHGLGSRPSSAPGGDEPEGQSSPPRQSRPAQCCLSNECLKLIRYQVLFVKRGLEVAFPTREELVWESLTGLQFQTWKVAEFVSELDEVPVPPKWLEKNYPPGKQQREIGGKQVWVIHALPVGDEKYLQVRCQLLRSYRRERLRFPERQLEVLAEIRDAIAPPAWTPSGRSSPAGLLPAGPDSGESSLLVSEQQYQAVVASPAGRAEAAQPDQPKKPKKAKAAKPKAKKKKAGQKKPAKKPTKAKRKKAASAKAKRGAKKPDRTRKRSSGA